MEKNEILMIYGQSYKEMAKRLLEAAKLEELIGDKNKRIALKPNLVLASPASNGATTHPELAAGVIEYLQERDFQNISIMEGSWVGAKTSESFEICGYNNLRDTYGVRLIDTQKESSHKVDAKGMELSICDCVKAIDFMINMPVLKGHCQTTVTCALKNNKGLIPNSEKRRYHTMGLHKPIAHLNAVLPQGFVLVDNICGDLDYEEGGTPVVMNRILGVRDPVLCDAFVCDIMGHPVEETAYIGIAEALGLGSADTQNAKITELNKSEDNIGQIAGGRRVKKLAAYTNQADACSACYGSLIHALDRMDRNGQLEQISESICIGQAFRGKSGGVGVGRCTKEFSDNVGGCPPKAIDIVKFLSEKFC